MHVVMLAYPQMTQLDLTGPFEVLSRFDELALHLAWKTTAPVADGHGLKIVPSVAFADCPQANILFVPGGPGQVALMEDSETLDFLRRQAEQASWVISVCTGSLVLAAAGLLAGHRASCHWLSLDQLALFGVEPVAERVVVDRDRVTGAGVTSGIDFALTLAARLFGEERARRVQLYRAGLGIDREHDEADRRQGHRVACPTLVLWSLRDDLEQLYGDVLGVWRPWTTAVRGRGLDCGHHMAEEAPVELASELAAFLAGS